MSLVEWYLFDYVGYLGLDVGVDPNWIFALRFEFLDLELSERIEREWPQLLACPVRLDHSKNYNQYYFIRSIKL